MQWTGPSPTQYPEDWDTITYKYDASGRRIEKAFDNGYKVQYIYDGGNVIAEYDSNNNLLRKYVHGAGVDQPVCMIDVADSNETYYYHFDGLGSVVALSDSEGDTVQLYGYNIYGQVLASDPNHPNPYMFTGRRFDIETGLYYYRARYYNPHIGRFMQTDPVGYSDGINWYSYCGNNPLSCVDPSGLNMTPDAGLDYGETDNWAWIVLDQCDSDFDSDLWDFWDEYDLWAIDDILVIDDLISDSCDAPPMIAGIDGPDFDFPLPEDWAPEWEWIDDPRDPIGGGRWRDPDGGIWRPHPDPTGEHGNDHYDYNPPYRRGNKYKEKIPVNWDDWVPVTTIAAAGAAVLELLPSDAVLHAIGDASIKISIGAAGTVVVVTAPQAIVVLAPNINLIGGGTTAPVAP